MSEAAKIEAKRRADERHAAFMAEVASWFEGKELTTDWMTRKASRWHRFLQARRNEPLNVLEVGSFEGRSALFLLNYLPQARLTCIDFFKGALDRRFDANLAPFGDRLTKLKGSAIAYVDILIRNGQQFDLIYLDAGKQRDHVLALSLLSWSLLKTDGILIWDDYDWGLDRPVEQRPHDGIDVFLKLHEGDYEMLWNQGQVFVRRTSPPAAPAGNSLHSPNLSY